MKQSQREYRMGVLQVVICMMYWGCLPIYWKSLIPIPSTVIITYRVFLLFVAAVLIARKYYTFREIFEPLKDWKTLLTFTAAGVIITANWSIYIWAVNAGFLIQTSIGYYIEPLMVCVFGIFLFKEKLTKYKSIAIVFATLAVLIILIHFHELPVLALALALTFSLYSAIKRTVKVSPILSQVYETIVLAPFMLAAIIYFEANGQGALAVAKPYQIGLLLLVGLATFIPQTLFASAAQKTSMFMLGLAQYISPTLQLLLGVFMYHESVDRMQVIAFSIIWVGLVFFTYGEFVESRRASQAESESE